jgi:hypothetical protein
MTVPYRPSNGTEGGFFYDDWCAKCQRESGTRQCKIFTAALSFGIDDPKYPKQWVSDDDGWPGNPRCTAFEERRAPVRRTMIRERRQFSLLLRRNEGKQP